MSSRPFLLSCLSIALQSAFALISYVTAPEHGSYAMVEHDNVGITGGVANILSNGGAHMVGSHEAF